MRKFNYAEAMFVKDFTEKDLRQCRNFPDARVGLLSLNFDTVWENPNSVTPFLGFY